MTEEQADQMLRLMAVQVALLAETRDLVMAAIDALSPPSADEQFLDGCQHPEEARVEMSTPGDLNHWVCNVCRFDNKAVA